MNVVLDRFQRKGSGAAGAAHATVSFGHPMFCLILYDVWQKKNIRESTKERGRR
jgi:hypothetical protein